MMDSMEIRRMKRFGGILVTVVIALLLAAIVSFLAVLATPHDDTDPPDGRSGMQLLTDHKTGCQYLYRRGAITPRMDADGKQICEVIR